MPPVARVSHRPRPPLGARSQVGARGSPLCSGPRAWFLQEPTAEAQEAGEGGGGGGGTHRVTPRPRRGGRAPASTPPPPPPGSGGGPGGNGAGPASRRCRFPRVGPPPPPPQRAGRVGWAAATATAADTPGGSRAVPRAKPGSEEPGGGRGGPARARWNFTASVCPCVLCF